MRNLLRTFPIFSSIILLALIIRLAVSGLSAFGVVAIVIAAIWWAFELVRWLSPDPDHAPPDALAPTGDGIDAEEDLVSLVYFLSTPREAAESSIRACVSGALGIKFDTENPNASYFVMEITPSENPAIAEKPIKHFVVRIPQGNFAILVSESPYIDDPKHFANDSIRDKRLRNAVESHQAWLSVDFMDPKHRRADQEAAYQVIGKTLSYLAGPDCLAIYSPQLQRCNEFDLSLIELLASEHPLELFEEPTFEPIIEISDNNPKMAAAVAEAQQRWPEFVNAFGNCDKESADNYIIKAEFREGKNCEYMWVQVTEIQEETIHGVLMNDPHELLEVHRGAQVAITLDRLNDWIYPTKDDSHVGGFTLDVLAEGED